MKMYSNKINKLWKSKINTQVVFKAQYSKNSFSPINKMIVREKAFKMNISKIHTTAKVNDSSFKVVKHSERISGSKQLEKSSSKERPISPHVTIFKFPIPAIASISNRFSAIGLVGGLALGSLITIVGGYEGLHATLDLFKSNAVINFLAKDLIAFPIIYHWLAEIRHLYWDTTAKGLKLPEVRTSSKALIASSVALTLIVALL
eukprot:TRINITY_DN16091_c0_g1_i1.p1 TRINITY_DN16091_c0_g1~~TRINITY_DN16091_c0_g1_i1.p1  ORF type:complete len:204 (-),score=49.58 TRINITY_DN16091_c0_g1_i1:63-674(-)